MKDTDDPRVAMVNKQVGKIEIFTFDPDSGERIELTPIAQCSRPLAESIVAKQPDLLSIHERSWR